MVYIFRSRDRSARKVQTNATLRLRSCKRDASIARWPSIYLFRQNGLIIFTYIFFHAKIANSQRRQAIEKFLSHMQCRFLWVHCEALQAWLKLCYKKAMVLDYIRFNSYKKKEWGCLWQPWQARECFVYKGKNIRHACIPWKLCTGMFPQTIWHLAC